MTEYYNPEDTEFTAESFGYDPLQSTGLEWNYHPVDEFIYQEYSDKGDTAGCSYQLSRTLCVRVIDACSPKDIEEISHDQQDEDENMAWKRFRSSGFLTIFKSMYIGALI